MQVWSEPSMVEAGAYEFADTAKFLEAGELHPSMHATLLDSDLEGVFGDAPLQSSALHFPVFVHLLFKVQGREPAVDHRTESASSWPGSTGHLTSDIAQTKCCVALSCITVTITSFVACANSAHLPGST